MTRTLIVIGAGASAELGLPTGEKLKKEISSLFRTDTQGQSIHDPQLVQIVYSFMSQGLRRHERLGDAARRISESLPLAISIDNFLDAHREDEDIQLMGKLAIVRSILAAERKCSLFRENGRPTLNFEDLTSTWYVKFFRLLVENCRIADLPDRFRRVRLVIFNYDRCVERFLVLALMQYFDLPAEKAVALLENLEIAHPYGLVGTFGPEPAVTRTAFGEKPETEKLLRLAGQIRTFTEGVPEGHFAGSMDVADLMDFGRIVFLGFAYHDQNLRLLFPEEVFDQSNSRTRQVVCLGTAYGVSDSDIEVLRDTLRTQLRKVADVRLSPKLCSDFFDENMRRLSFVGSQ